MEKCAFDIGTKCTALTRKQCVGCNFRKTREELEEGRRKAIHRINSLSDDEKIYIRRTYYSGRGMG